MKAARITRLAPDWLLTYAGAILAIGVLTNLAASFAQYTHTLTLPSMRDDLGISYTQAGILVTMAAVIRMASSLASGTLAPRYGSRAIIGVGSIGAGGSMFFLAAAPNFFVALAAMALMGFCSGFALTPMMGLLSSWFAVRNRGLAAGLAAAGGSIALVAAGVLVPWLTSLSPTEGWRHTWYLFGAVVIVIGFLALVFLREQPKSFPTPASAGPSRRPQRGAWPLEAYKNPLVWLISFLAFCSGWSSGIFNTFFGAYLTDENGVDLVVAGRLLILIAVLSVGSGVLWGRVSDRLGRGQAFLLSFLVQGISFALFALLPVMGAFVIASVLMGLTLRAAYTICAASAGDYVPVQFSAAAFALMSVLAGLGSSLSPVIGGVIADTAPMMWVMVVALVWSVVGIAGGFILHRAPAAPPQPAPAEQPQGRG